jgi:lysophospholipase L1-like esterase
LQPFAPSSAPLTAAGFQQLGGAHWSKLQGWFAALGSRQTAKANIVVMGDSITAGQGATTFAGCYQQLLAGQLRTRFPTPGLSGGGRGFLPPIIPPSNPTTFTYTTIASPANQAGLIAGSLFGFGPNLETWDISTSGGNTLTYHLVGDSADILWAGNPGNGTFGWAVDAGGVTSVSTNVALSFNSTHISLGAPGAHTLTITNVSGTPTFITGVIENNGDAATGIQVHNCGFSGATSAFWTAAGGAAQLGPALVPLSPGLIVIELGVNDPANSISATTTQANLKSVIASIRASLSPAPPVLLLAAYNAASDGPTTAAQWQAYVNGMIAVAAGDPAVDVLDLSIRMPGTAAANTWSLYNVDGIHPNNRGHQVIADVLTEFLSPA